MKIYVTKIVLSFVVAYVFGDIRNNSLADDIHSTIYASNQLGLKLMQNLSHTQNAFLSPISISMSIAVIYSGARNMTADEIQRSLQYPNCVRHAFKGILNFIQSLKGGATTPQYQIEIANALLVDQSFNILKSFKEQSKDDYDATVESVSFSLQPEAAVESVNGWVAWKTKNKIRSVLQEPLDPLTKLFVLNAVYFKGTWKTKFDQRLTMPDTFYNDGRIPKTVPMMRQKRKLKYGFDSRIQGQVIELPFLGDHIVMLIVLPEKRDGLAEMESALLTDSLENLQDVLREVNVQVTLPRFSLSEEYDLIPFLKQLGVNHLFDVSSVNLTGISSRPGLYISKVIHKCALQVNEEGGEAAAVSSVSAGVRTGGPLVPLFTADHPFLFFIEDRHLNLTLFMGRITHL